MAESLQFTLDDAVRDNQAMMPWSPTHFDKQSSQSRSTSSADSWKTQRGPIPSELPGAREEFVPAMDAETDELSSPSGSSNHSDQGAIVSDLKSALPTLLQENSLFKERMYAQSEIEPDASPTADRVHDKILQEQCRPRRSRSSPLTPDVLSDMTEQRSVLLGKTPPDSPPLKLPHFSSQSTLTAEHAPLQREGTTKIGIRNIQLLESLRKNEILADPLFTLPLHTRPALPKTASANEVTFLLSTQAQRRRKQIHSERVGESVFSGQERRAVRRRLEHVALGKDHDVWLPSTAHSPALAYSELDEEHVAILIVSPAKECTDYKGPIADRIPIMEDTPTRVVRYLRAQSAIETTTANNQTRSSRDSTLRKKQIFDMTADADVISVGSGKSLYLHPNAQINGNSESSTNLQPILVTQCHKAGGASINLIEQFPAPVSVAPEEEPIKRASPPKADIAGFEEHSKRRQRRKQRPESLTHHLTVASTTQAALRTPLSPRSSNIGVDVGESHSSIGDTAFPEPLATADASDPHTAAGSPTFLHEPPAFRINDQENLRPVTESKEITKAHSSPAHSVPPQSPCIQLPAHSAGPTIQDKKSSFDSQVPVPILQRVSPAGSHPPSPKRKHRHRHRRGPVVFAEEGIGKATVYSSEKSYEGASRTEKSPSSGSMDSAKAKGYLRHLNEHVDNLCQERDQAVGKVSVLEEEVGRLKLTVAILKREMDHWEA